MTVTEWLGTISAVLVAFSYLPYIVTFAKGRTKPHAFSWLIWGAMNIITFFAMLAANAGPGAWLVAPGMVISTGIGFAALYYGERNITHGDCIAFVLAILSVLAWKITADPFYAILFMLVGDLFAWYPTVRKTWSKPREENIVMYLIYIVAAIISLFALSEYNATNLLAYVGTLAFNMFFAAMVYGRRYVLGNKK